MLYTLHDMFIYISNTRDLKILVIGCAFFFLYYVSGWSKKMFSGLTAVSLEPIAQVQDLASPAKSPTSKYASLSTPRAVEKSEDPRYSISRRNLRSHDKRRHGDQFSTATAENEEELDVEEVEAMLRSIPIIL